MAAQYIFQMQGLSKTFPGGKKLFENVWLSFYPDAKIGVVGVNGSGKSTLLKIMAGIDGEFTGEARAADGVKMGYSRAGAASRSGARCLGQRHRLVRGKANLRPIQRGRDPHG